jgi:hypothetical protein
MTGISKYVYLFLTILYYAVIIAHVVQYPAK